MDDKKTGNADDKVAVPAQNPLLAGWLHETTLREYQIMLKQGLLSLFILSWAVAGGLAYYALQQQRENIAFEAMEAELLETRQRYQEQVAVNARQREEFETRVQSLEENLRSSQAQMSNLSAALQEARELMEPVARQVIEQLAGDQPPASDGNTDDTGR
ncbi:MAG: hypothetical protein R3F41_15240 [Gammaproteobacteria bacterium]|nr:hypothetical protein [Pseudomonadales bacterium]MCP5346874.1 hypothetical protein [Pseudomonadales bacterium]